MAPFGTSGHGILLTVGVVVAIGMSAFALLRRGETPREGASRDYSRVEQLRAEQDAEGTHDEHVRQRFFRHYKAHPENAMYVYLWARCVDDATEQLRLAEEGIHDDAKFSWNYNVAARALARLGRVPEAYERAMAGAAVDPANIQLAAKVRALKLIIDRKLATEVRPTPSAYVKYDKDSLEKAGGHYQGLFQSLLRSPERADVQAIEKSRLADPKEPRGPVGDEVRGLVVCQNPYADTCMRVYVARDPHLASVWAVPSVDVTTIHERDLVTVSGAVVTNGKGENILLADSLTTGAP